MSGLPRSLGVYALRLRLSKSCELEVGRLGRAYLAAGEYTYLGSAYGPGGLRARLGRHLLGNPRRLHWHVDYLRQVAVVSGCCYLVTEPGTVRLAALECLWSQALLDLPGVSAPQPGFGASDCRCGCRAHLVILPELFDRVQVRQTLAQAAGVPPEALTRVVLPGP